MEEQKKSKKKIRLKGLLNLILALYLLGTLVYHFLSLPIKNIEIVGNYYLKDNYLISYLDLENASIISVSKHDIVEKFKKIELISDVSVSKNYLGKLEINIIEDKIFFYNWNNKKLVLSSGKEIEYNDNYLGVPVLINIVPDEIYQELIEKLNKVDISVFSLISEIEYSRSMINDKVVDDKRFIFRMNDGNIVYINTINIEKINNYAEIYEGIVNKKGNVKGCLYLDSNSDTNHFNNCEELPSNGGEDSE